MIKYGLQLFGGRGGASGKIMITNVSEQLKGLTKRDIINSTSDTIPGLSSESGKMKKVILYHGSYADFNNFDYSKSEKRGSDLYGEGFYFTDDLSTAKMFGDKIYTVEVSYSTNFRTAKKTGRDTDFMYQPDTGYWIIPKNKSNNLRILKKDRV